MPGYTVWARFIWPPGEWGEIAWGTTRYECDDLIIHWVLNNTATIRDHEFSIVVLQDKDGHPQPKGKANW